MNSTSQTNALPFANIPRPVLLGGSIALLLALLLSGWWLLRPQNGLLFRDLDPGSAAEVVAALQEMGVRYEFAEKGSQLLIPESRILATRMELASRGIPHNGSIGFELFTDADYGMTDFAQKVNFQRALQGELERTIVSLKEVRAARVHLTLPRDSAFFRERKPPKASVTVTTVNDAILSHVQIAGIQHLVAAAVEGMDADTVVILDHYGTPLSGTGATPTSIGIGNHLDEKQRIEAGIKNKVTELLESTFGLNAFSVSVSATLNFDRIKETREQVLPQGQNGNGLILRRTGNQLPASDNGNSIEEIEYALGKSVEEIVYAPGRIEKLAVAVLLSDSLDETELAHLQDLIAAATGINKQRGDQLVVTTFGASQATTSMAEPSPAREIPQIQPTAHATDMAITFGNLNLSREVTSLVIAAGGLVVLLFALLLYLALRLRAARGRRMNGKEREAAIADIRSWIAEPLSAGTSQ